MGALLSSSTTVKAKSNVAPRRVMLWLHEFPGFDGERYRLRPPLECTAEKASDGIWEVKGSGTLSWNMTFGGTVAEAWDAWRTAMIPSFWEDATDGTPREKMTAELLAVVDDLKARTTRMPEIAR